MYMGYVRPKLGENMLYTFFKKNRECDFYEKLRVGKTNRPPTDPTDRPVPYRSEIYFIALFSNFIILIKLLLLICIYIYIYMHGIVYVFI